MADRKNPSKKVRVGMVKAQSAWGDVKGNLELLETLALPHANEGLDVLITPECFLDGYMVRDRERITLRKLSARCVKGPTDPVIRRVGTLAKKLGSYVVVGASEKDGNGVVRNAAYLIDRGGRTVGTYYKIHSGELYEPGNALPVFETDFAVAGIIICADRRWPENIRCLALGGAQIILNPTWGFKGDLNTAIMRTRAYENGIPICFTHPTQSLICDGRGEVVAFLESSDHAVLVHDVEIHEDPTSLKWHDRSSGPPNVFRRPDLYGPITEMHEKSP